MANLSAYRSRRALALTITVFIALLAFDLSFKSWTFDNVASRPVDMVEIEAGNLDGVPPHEGKILIPNILKLRLVVNRGAVFGMMQGQRVIFVLATIVAIGLIVYFFCDSTEDQWVFHVALAMILAGALGNLYDRIMYLGVRDMLHLFPDVNLPFGWRWPRAGSRELYPWIFNLADAFLLIGVGTIFARSVWLTKKENAAADAAEAP
jgi:signal peptidase II